MPVLIDLLWLLAGLTALYFGADWLVGGASKLAVKFGISPLVVGLTVVAFGTSAPELFVSIGFNQGGYPDMALGNVIGSNICNIGLVLGVSAFICVLTIKNQLLMRDLPILMIASLVFCWMLMNGVIGRVEGCLLFVAVIAYTFFQLVLARKVKDPEVLEEYESELDPDAAQKEPIWKLIVFILVGLVGLYFGAEWLERGGVSIAKRMGVPEAVISLTLIAFSTSVPELATSIIASLKREGDIIVGNVIGSCIFNLLSVVGITAMVSPLVTTQIEMADLIVMGGFTALLIPIMKTGKRISRWEGGILLALYAAYCGYLWVDRVA
ncbi:MAG: calcium/sodium antiporter [Verrucomicrobiales bacterium]|nr:calcium/sodium antiporter [Verrucomicrobiales bacterium]